MSQTARILALLRQGPLTPLDALDRAGSFRLGARIWELRHQGYEIRTEWLTTSNGSRIARYILVDREQQDFGL